jgi:O-antigen ligase
MAAVSSPAYRAGGPAHGAASAVLGVGALTLLGVAMGIGLVAGELEAAFIGIAAAACLAILYDFRFGAVLLIVMLPISESSFFPRGMFGVTGLNPMNLLLMATLASYVLHGRLHPRAGPIATKPLLWLYVLPILAAGALGSAHVQDIYEALYEMESIHFINATGYLRDIVLRPLLMVLIALLVGAALARAKKPEGFLVPIGVAIWVLGALSIQLVARTSMSLADLSGSGARTFMSGIGLHANDLGRLYAVAYALLLFTWAESRSATLRWACLASIGVVVIALVFTFSRGAFLGFMVVNALFVLWRFNARSWGFVVAAGLVLLVALPPEVYERVALGFDQDANAVSAGRIEGIWLPLVPELLKSPLWGSGLGSVMWSDAMRHGLMLETTHPHNAYLEAYLDMGLIGLGLLLAFYWHVWRGFRALGSNAFLSPEMRGFYKGAAAALVSFAVTGLAGSSLLPRPEYSLLWLAIGMMYGQLARGPAR